MGYKGFDEPDECHPTDKIPLHKCYIGCNNFYKWGDRCRKVARMGVKALR